MLDDILGKIESEKKWFDTLVSVMRKIPELGPLADELEMAQKLEEDRSTRDVLVIRPPPPRGISLPIINIEDPEKDPEFYGDGQSPEDDRSSEEESDDTTSMFEYELLTFLKDNEMELIVDTKLYDEASISKSDQQASDAQGEGELLANTRSIAETAQARPLLSPVSEPCERAVNFTYSVLPTPRLAFYDDDKETSKESNTSSEKTETVIKPLSKCHVMADVRKIKKLKKQPGVIVSQRDNEIADLSIKYGEKTRQVEDVGLSSRR